MSAQSWLEEFYPESAASAARKGTEAAIEHSLRKWRGATDENLTKHGLTRGFENTVVLGDPIALNSESGDEVIVFGVSTCALCTLFHPGCSGCPLVDADDEPCYEFGRGYDVFANGGGPEVMIEELETALAKWRKENGQS